MAIANNIAFRSSSFTPTFEVKFSKQPLPDEIVVVNFHQNKITVDEAHKIIDQLQKDFPYNQIVGKFDCYDIYRTPCIEVL